MTIQGSYRYYMNRKGRFYFQNMQDHSKIAFNLNPDEAKKLKAVWPFREVRTLKIHPNE